MYASAMLMNFLRHTAFLIILLRYLYDNLFGLGVNKLLHFLIELINSSFENGFYITVGLLGIFFSKLISIWQFSTALKDEWRACQKLSSLIYG